MTPSSVVPTSGSDRNGERSCGVVIEPTFRVEMFPAGWGRWHYLILWQDGIVARSTQAVWRYGAALAVAHRHAQQARECG